MTLIDFVAAKIRKSGPNPAINTKWGGAEHWSSILGTRISEDEALSLSTYYAGKTLIASGIASLPLHVYRDDDQGTPRRVSGRDADKTYYLWGAPNSEQTRMSFFERVIGDEVTSDGFIWVDKNDIGMPAEIWHIERHRIRITREKGGQRRKIYVLDGEYGLLDYAQGGEMVHIPNWGTGVGGWDIVRGASKSFALGLTAESYAQESFDTGPLPPAVITPESTLKEGEAERWLAEWTRLRRAGRAKVAIMGNAKIEQLNFDLEKMQMVEIRKFQAGDIATLLGVPPHMVGLVDKTSSWGAGVAEQFAGFARFTLTRHIVRFEQAINQFLLVRDLTGMYCKFELGGILRGTTLQQYQANTLALRWKTRNEIRALDDLPPKEGGDELLEQAQYVPIDELTKVGAMPPKDPKPAGETPADDSDEEESPT